MTTERDEIGTDLQITRITRQDAGAGTWVCGCLDGHRFQALVFPQHAENPEYELGASRIAKLWIERLTDRGPQRLAARTTVANFERGWDVRPTDDLAARIADFLAAGLAEHVFGA